MAGEGGGGTHRLRCPGHCGDKRAGQAGQGTPTSVARAVTCQGHGGGSLLRGKKGTAAREQRGAHVAFPSPSPAPLALSPLFPAPVLAPWPKERTQRWAGRGCQSHLTTRRWRMPPQQPGTVALDASTRCGSGGLRQSCKTVDRGAQGWRSSALEAARRGENSGACTPPVQRW